MSDLLGKIWVVRNDCAEFGPVWVDYDDGVTPLRRKARHFWLLEEARAATVTHGGKVFRLVPKRRPKMRSAAEIRSKLAHLHQECMSRDGTAGEWAWITALRWVLNDDDAARAAGRGPAKKTPSGQAQ